jgi:pimeloyl-ACP methyl ester carboxylesterase
MIKPEVSLSVIGLDQPEEMKLTVAGAELRYQTRGKGAPLLWLHGIWGEPGWLPHLQALAEHFQVYKIDLPGYFGSEKPSWVSSVRDLAYFMLDVLDTLGLERTLVVGHCLGGWLGAELGLLRPQRVSKLALISPLGIINDWTQAPNVFYADPAKLPSFFFADYQSCYEEAKHFVPKDIDGWGEEFLTNRQGSAYYVFDPYLHDPRLIHRLHHLAAPTLAVWGSRDIIVGPEHSEEWVGRIVGGQKVIIQGVGHIPFVEAPDRFLDIMVEFLTDGA